MRPTAFVVGTGLTAAAATNELVRSGWEVTMVEAQQRIGGNVVPQQIGGVFFEPDGPHIVHTDNPHIAAWLGYNVELNEYRHTVMSDTELGLLSWPPQISELQKLADWPRIEAELAARSEAPDPTNFETYAVGLMGPTLYRIFIRDYTEKQWGRPAHELSSSFAPKRIDLRDDDYRPLFRDSLQGWPREGWGPAIKRLLSGAQSIHLGARMTADMIDPGDYTAVLVTSPLDDFLGEEPLEWRGIRTESTYYPDQVGYRLPAPVVNCPTLRTEYTRMTETKQMAQQDATGTVITYEFPGADARHYPVDDAAGKNRARANELRYQLTHWWGENVVAAGRLATYSYINMDQAVSQGLTAARKMKEFAG